MKKKLFPLLFILAISSCSTAPKSDYEVLQESCKKNPATQNVCNASIKRMEQNGWKAAEKKDDKYNCPEGTFANGMKAAGAIWWCEPHKVTPTATGSLGQKTLITQTDDETTLAYSGKILKTWSHHPPDKTPFIWDEGCQTLTEKLAMIPHDVKNMENEKQKSWESLTDTERKSCIQENLARTLRAEVTSNPRFISIIKTRYEGFDRMLIDTETGKKYDSLQEDLVSIQNLGSYIVVHTRSNHDTSDEVLIFSYQFDMLKKWSDDKKFVRVKNIELTNDKKSIKLTTKEMKEIIIAL